MPPLGVDTSNPVISENTGYLADTNLLALLEMGLEATLKEFRVNDEAEQSPCGFLASWLMRHNPKHHERGQELLEAFTRAMQEREALADVSNLEDEHQREQAAVAMQTAMRGHAARVMRGEQTAAASTLQAGYRGRSARKQVASESGAATKMQAMHRGRTARSEFAQRGSQGGEGEEAGAEEEGGYDPEQDVAAAKMQASMRGRMARQELAEQGTAATKVQSVYRGKQSRA